MILDFEDEKGNIHFRFCFIGFILGGSMQQTKSMQILRTEVALFEKFESISDLKPDGKRLINGELERQLKVDGSRQLQINAAEYDLLFNYVAIVPWHTGSPSRNALETLDWLTASSRT